MRAATVPFLSAISAAPAVASLDDRLPMVASSAAASISPLALSGSPEVRPLFASVPQAGAAASAASAAAAAQVREEAALARLEAERAAQEKARGELDKTIQRYVDGIARLQGVVRELGKPLAGEIVELAMVVAREIIGRELSTDRSRIADVVAEALADADGDAGVVVRMNPADLAELRERRPELAQGASFVADRRLAPGGCVVESASQVIDASIEARLDAVRIAVVRELGAGEGAAR
jgi:flagellar assembly protein FliH